jgi:hypothetical protein
MNIRSLADSKCRKGERRIKHLISQIFEYNSLTSNCCILKNMAICIKNLSSVQVLSTTTSILVKPWFLILWVYFVSFVSRYGSMALWTHVRDIFKALHAAREKNRASQSKPYAEKQNKKIVYKTLLIYTMYLTLLYKGKCTMHSSG